MVSNLGVMCVFCEETVKLFLIKTKKLIFAMQFVIKYT